VKHDKKLNKLLNLCIKKNMTNRLKILRLEFENEIEDYEIPAFRAAIAKKVEKDNTLFHHHLDDNIKIYKYPVIQFKRINKHPTIICLECENENASFLLSNKDWNIKIGDKKVELKVFKIELKQFNLEVIEDKKSYNIYNWIALNSDNYANFINSDSFIKKLTILEKTLIAHIISFAEGVNWDIDKKIQLSINKINKERWTKYKKVSFLSFDVSFTTNVSLPDYIGLGKSVSVGYGMIKKANKKRFDIKKEND
jgi:hypothetical protein